MNVKENLTTYKTALKEDIDYHKKQVKEGLELLDKLSKLTQPSDDDLKESYSTIVDVTQLNPIVKTYINEGLYLSDNQIRMIWREVSKKYNTDLIKINYETVS